MERMDEYLMDRWVLMAEVSGGLVRTRPRLGWMDGVKEALGNSGMTVKAAQQCAKDRKEWRALAPMELNEFHCGYFLLALCSFGPPSRALVVITWRGEGCRYMMQLGETVKRAQLLKIKAQVSSIWAKGCMFDDCVCVI